MQPMAMSQQAQPGMAGQQMRASGVPSPSLESVSIDEIVETDVVTAEPDTPLTELTNMMQQEDVGAVVVVEDEEPTGIVTDRKVALSLDEIQDPEEATAADVATEDIVTGTISLTVFDALNKMNDNSIRRFPIVDEEGNLQGIITLDDLLVLLGTELEKAASIVQSQSPRL